MNIIENFAALSEQEQRVFAEKLIKTINSEKLFTDETEFTIGDVWADELAGDLTIETSTTGAITVRRNASWQANDREDADDRDISTLEVDYDEYAYKDVQKALKTLVTVIDGYRVTAEVGDTDYEETVDVELESVVDDDSGIGSYEYWGEVGYDSHPYVEVTGIREEKHSCYVTFTVEPDNTGE
jgi:hypothetical protein